MNCRRGGRAGVRTLTAGCGRGSQEVLRGKGHRHSHFLVVVDPVSQNIDLEGKWGR